MWKLGKSVRERISLSGAGVRQGFWKGANGVACIPALLAVITDELFFSSSSNHIWEERDLGRSASPSPSCRGPKGPVVEPGFEELEGMVSYCSKYSRLSIFCRSLQGSCHEGRSWGLARSIPQGS